jgi:hypothetical protein
MTLLFDSLLVITALWSWGMSLQLVSNSPRLIRGRSDSLIDLTIILSVVSAVSLHQFDVKPFLEAFWMRVSSRALTAPLAISELEAAFV